MGQASIVTDTVNGIPDLGHDATLEELVLVGRHLVVAMVAVFCYDKVWPVFVHVFDVDLILSSYMSHVQCVVKEFDDHVHVFRVHEGVVYSLHNA